MSYYQNKVPPVREDRLTVTTAFGGCARALREASRSGCSANCAQTFSQTNACQLMLTIGMAQTIPESALIFHGPVGCGAQSNMQEFAVRSATAARGGSHGRFLWASTNLKAPDVIGGGGAKLEEAILGIDREFSPKVIFVAMTCTPSIVGDDPDEVISRLRSEVSAVLVPLHCPGFKTGVVATAYDTFYHGILNNFDFDPKPYVDYEPLNKFAPDYALRRAKFEYLQGNTVNLLNASSMGAPDEKEIIRLLRALDPNVNVYTEYTRLEEFRKISLAALNISMCNVHDDYLATYLEERFGTPFHIDGMPLGIARTGAWLRGVAKRFGREEKAKRVIKAEEDRLEAALGSLREKLKGKRVLLNGGVIRVAALAVLMKELGLEVVNIRPYHYDNLSDEPYKQVEEEFPDVQINVAANQLFEFVNLIRKYKPDVCIDHGGSNAWAMKTGVPSVPLFSPNQYYFAYRGAYEQALRIAKAFENPRFVENVSRHTQLPYTDAWYEKDPYHYIRG
jgi:nitrogenase molybdenum-iron protein alpha chain